MEKEICFCYNFNHIAVLTFNSKNYGGRDIHNQPDETQTLLKR